MGGSLDRVTILDISDKDSFTHGRERERLSDSFKSFDVQNAQCFKEEERRKLLNALEAGFGSFEVFNSLVSHLFTLDSPTSPAQRLSSVPHNQTWSYSRLREHVADFSV